MPTTYEYPCLVYRQRPAQTRRSSAYSTPRPRHPRMGRHSPAGGDARGNGGLVTNRRCEPVRRFLGPIDNTIPAVVISLNLPAEAGSRRVVSPRSVSSMTLASHRSGWSLTASIGSLGVQSFNADMHLNVVALLLGDLDEAAFQFMVINQKGEPGRHGPHPQPLRPAAGQPLSGPTRFGGAHGRPPLRPGGTGERRSREPVPPPDRLADHTGSSTG